MGKLTCYHSKLSRLIIYIYIIYIYIYIYSVVELQQVPTPKETAQKILDNFVRYRPGQSGKRAPLEEDTVIVMDASGSIRSCEFGEGRKAMATMMKTCTEKGASCRFAGVTYSSFATRSFDFSPITKASQEIRAIPYYGDGTNTKAGLEEAERIFRAGLRIKERQLHYM